MIRVFFWIFVIGLLASGISKARAEQTSILCRTTDTQEFIDIVTVTGHRTRVLVQINGGKFYDGQSEFEDPYFYVLVQFDQGVFALKFDVESMAGQSGMNINGNKAFHPIKCKFR